jgi:hypothetical protein
LFMIAVWLWALFDCLKNETDVGLKRVIWLAVIVCTCHIGGIIYLAVRRPRRRRALGR